MFIKGVNIKFDNKVIYDNFSIDFEDNKINCIVGASGCGKTTLLNYICDELLAKDVKISYVFQEDRLIPWKNVFDNLSIVIKNKYKREMMNDKIEEILKILDINGAKYLYPDELSGGMKQKVNIARALLYDFDVLLLDEPFRSLDAKIKNVLINLIRTISYEGNRTIILVSHDKDEVKALADNVIMISGSPISIVKKGDKAIVESIFSSIIR